jgi:hypothetical protein
LNVTFTVEAYSYVGSASYQWMSGVTGSGTYTNVVDADNISGAATPNLVITNVSLANAADYLVVVSDAEGSVTSSVVTLTVQEAPTDIYGAAVFTDKPVAWWRMGETNGNRLYDYMGGGHDATIGGAYVLGGPPISTFDPTPSVVFNGENTYSPSLVEAIVPYSPDLNTLIFSVEAWCFATNRMSGGGGTYGTVIGNRPGATVGYEIAGHFESPVDTFHFFLGNLTNSWLDRSAGPIATGQWNHVVGVYDGTNWVNYVNGEQRLNLPYVYHPNPSADLTIGALFGSASWPGYINEVALYNTNLTADQVLNHYALATFGGYNPPAITQQPQPLALYAGRSGTFSVQVSSYSPPTYQWMAGAVGSGTYTNLVNANNISGSTTANLTISGMTAANVADYLVVVSNPGGSVTSSVATLTLLAPPQVPVVLDQPQPLTLLVGRTGQFRVWPVGQAPLSYQWQVGAQPDGAFASLADGNWLSGSTTTNLFLANLTLDKAGYYRVVVSNPNGSVTSSVVQLAVLSQAALQLRLPLSEAGPGTTTSSDTNLGLIDVTLQMYSDGSTTADLHGAPGSGLTNLFPNAGCLDLTSDTVPSQDDTQPGNNNGIGPGVIVVGNPALAVLGSNGTISNYVLTFWFSQAIRNMTYGYAHFFVLDPTDSLVKDGATNTMGASLVWGNEFLFNFGTTSWSFYSPYSWYPTNEWVFAAVAEDGINQPTAYIGTTSLPALKCSASPARSWSPVQLGANPSLTLGNRPDTWNRSLNGRIADFRFYNGMADPTFVEAIRASALLHPVSITTPPASQSVAAGASATFSVTASGDQLSYQWYANGAALPGATSSSYTTPPATAADNGAQYAVIVNSPVNAQASTPATLTVSAPLEIGIKLSNGTVMLTWPAGTLLEAGDLLGPWTTNVATSPLYVTPTNAHMFYRFVK